MIKVIVDSGMDQNAYLKEQYDYDFLPLSIIIEDMAYLDGDEINLTQLHKAMSDGKMPSTSQPSPGQVSEILEKHRLENNDVIFVTLWEKLSGTNQVIRSVVDEYKEKYPDFKIAIIDCRSGSIAETLIAVQVLEMIKAGHTFEEVVAQAEWNAEHLSIYLTVENLKWLVKGGRLSKAAGYIGSALNVKPILTVNDEELFSEKMVRGNKRVYSQLATKMKEITEDFQNQIIFISHVGQEDNAKALEALVLKEIPEAKTMILEFGAVLAAHIGLGGVAIAALNAKPETYILPEE